MDLLVSTAALYVSYKTHWKESSRAPSLASSSARSLRAAVKRPASSSLARSALDKCALHFVTPSRCGLHPQCLVSIPGLVSTRAGLHAAVRHFGPRSRPRSTVAQSDTYVAPGSDTMMACQCHSAHNSARKIRCCTGRERSAWHHALSKPTRGKSRGFAPLPIQLVRPCDPCMHIKEPSTKQLASPTVANNTWVYPHTNRTIVRASRSVLRNRVVHQASLPLEFVASLGLALMLTGRRKVHAGFSVGWTSPTIDAAPSPTQLVHTSDKKRVLSDSRLVRDLLRRPSPIVSHLEPP